MDNNSLHQLCEDWAHWHRSRRLFAPPVQENILARLQPRPMGCEPDAICSANLSYFNLAILAQPEGDEKTTFYLYYIHRAGNIKKVADLMGISRRAFYKRIENFRSDAWRSYRRMMGGESVYSHGAQNTGAHIRSLSYDF